MSSTIITVQEIMLSTASAPQFTAADGPNGNCFANDGTVFLYIRNTGASAITAVVLANTAYAGTVFPPYTASIASALVGMVFGPFLMNTYNISGDGNVYINWSASALVTGTTVAALSLPTTGV